MSLWIIAVILGIVEGLTEFIPVSSTGHLLLAEHFLKLNGVAVDQTFFGSEVFNAVIQVGAMLAALPLFSDRLATLKNWQNPATQSYFLKMFVSFCITVAGALLLKKLGLQLPHEINPIALALLIGGILFVVVEFLIRGRKGNSEVTWALAVAFGVGQLIAVAFPGASRSGSTILLALILGMARGPAVEFSFLLGVPTLCAAGVKVLWDAHKTHEVIQWGPLIVSTIVSAVFSVIAVRWMLGYVRNHTFNGFGIYRILIGVVLLVIAFTGIYA